MNKARKSILNAIIGVLQFVVPGFISLFLNRIILKKLGSDVNGVNATVTQTLAILALLEGGFTLASIVALYKPYTEKDYDKINSILSTSSHVFRRIGVITLIVGLVISLVIPIFIKSDLSYLVLVVLFAFSLVPQVYNFLFVLKYRLIFQAAQKEYYVLVIQLITTVLTQVLSISILYIYPNIIALRAISLIGSLLSGYLIFVAARKNFMFLDMSLCPDYSLIKGSKDVFVTNITSFLYTSSTVLFLSIVVNTKNTSVYAVYASILNIVTSAIYAVLVAPQNALGLIISEGKAEKTYEIFQIIEYINVLLIFIVMTTVYSLIVPFVSIYTEGVKDVNYVDEILSLFMVLTAIFEAMHIPSGQGINLHGCFKSMRNIQLIAVMFISVSSIFGGSLWGMYGIVGAKALTSIYLFIAETWYMRKRIMRKSYTEFILVLLPNGLLSFFLSYFMRRMNNKSIVDFSSFVIQGFISIGIALVGFLLINMIIFPDKIKRTFAQVCNVFKRRDTSNA